MLATAVSPSNGHPHFCGTPEEKRARSSKMQRQGLQQCFDPVPSNLHTDTNQEKRQQLCDHGHPRCSEDSRQPVRKSIAQENADREESKGGPNKTTAARAESY